MTSEFAERFDKYRSLSSIELMPRLPIVIQANGRGFKKLCRNLRKPYEPFLLEALVNTMLATVFEMTGVVYAYQHSDRICFLLRDEFPLGNVGWYNNKIQEMVSVVSGLVALHFNKNLVKLNLELEGDAIFKVEAFSVPSINEAINYLIWQQILCFSEAADKAANHFLLKKYNKQLVQEMLHQMPAIDKIALLREELGIEFEEEFPCAFRQGVGLCKVPTITMGLNKQTLVKNKWKISWDLLPFRQNRDSILNILTHGHDLLREDNISL